MRLFSQVSEATHGRLINRDRVWISAVQGLVMSVVGIFNKAVGVAIFENIQPKAMGNRQASSADRTDFAVPAGKAASPVLPGFF